MSELESLTDSHRVCEGKGPQLYEEWEWRVTNLHALGRPIQSEYSSRSCQGTVVELGADGAQLSDSPGQCEMQHNVDVAPCSCQPVRVGCTLQAPKS
jgi:hypothetical protein